MAMVETVLNREHINYTKIQKVSYSKHEKIPTEKGYIERRVTENLIPTSMVSREVWRNITRCENFETIGNKDGSLIILLKDETRKIGDY
jgi:hypothetical protein